MVSCHSASKLYTYFALKLAAFWAPAMPSMMLLPLTMPVVAIKKLRPDDKPDQCFSATCFHPSLACILSGHPTQGSNLSIGTPAKKKHNRCGCGSLSHYHIWMRWTQDQVLYRSTYGGQLTACRSKYLPKDWEQHLSFLQEFHLRYLQILSNQVSDERVLWKMFSHDRNRSRHHTCPFLLGCWGLHLSEQCTAQVVYWLARSLNIRSWCHFQLLPGPRDCHQSINEVTFSGWHMGIWMHWQLWMCWAVKG